MRAQSSHTLEGALIVVLLALAGGMLYLVEISPSTADALMPFVLLLIAAIAVFWRLRRWPARPWFVLVMFSDSGHRRLRNLAALVHHGPCPNHGLTGVDRIADESALRPRVFDRVCASPGSYATSARAAGSAPLAV